MIRCAAIIAMLLPGLALAGWKPTDEAKPVGPGKSGFAVQLPAGWLYDTSSNSVMASHDGMPLDHITVWIVPHKKAFKDAKKPSSPTSAPEDLAESYLAELQTGQGAVRELVVIANEPAELAGKPAFRVHFKFRACECAGGAPMESVTLGTPLESGLLLASYVAPSIHYFPRWLADFDAAAKSIALVAAPK